jgi:hypothetical protein
MTENCITELGFVKVGDFPRYDLRKDHVSRGASVEDMLSELGGYGSFADLVYIYVCNDEVVYVGETKQSLRDRLNNRLLSLTASHKRHSGASARWLEFMNGEGSYSLWIRTSRKIAIDGVTVSLRLTEEQALIKKFMPRLNTKSK